MPLATKSDKTYQYRTGSFSRFFGQTGQDRILVNVMSGRWPTLEIPLLIAFLPKLTIFSMNLNYTKPSGLTPEYGGQFQDRAIVRAYKHREPYPKETFKILRELAGSPHPAVADIGCGPGDLSFGMYAGHRPCSSREI